MTEPRNAPLRPGHRFEREEVTSLAGPGPLAAPFYSLILCGRSETALARLAAARGAALREGAWDVVAELSELTCEAYFWRGQYAQALDWHHQAVELRPELAEAGRNSVPAMLREQGELAQAEALARRNVAALAVAGDDWAVPYARLLLGSVLASAARQQPCSNTAPWCGRCSATWALSRRRPPGKRHGNCSPEPAPAARLAKARFSHGSVRVQGLFIYV